MNVKEACAKRAFDMIEEGMTVGLGGGSTVALLIKKIGAEGKRITAVTPSQDTYDLCREHHIAMVPISDVSEIEVAFDGCDEVDVSLSALKSSGGIHVREKLVAAMAKEYVLLADEDKFFDVLPFHYPVTMEVLRPAKSYVCRVLDGYGVKVKPRRGGGKTGIVISDDGNYIMEAVFPKGTSTGEQNRILDGTQGVVGHGIFHGLASKAIIARKDGVHIVARG